MSDATHSSAKQEKFPHSEKVMNFSLRPTYTRVTLPPLAAAHEWFNRIGQEAPMCIIIDPSVPVITSGQSIIDIRPHRRRRRTSHSYSPGGANVPSHVGTLAPPGEYD